MKFHIPAPKAGEKWRLRMKTTGFLLVFLLALSANLPAAELLENKSPKGLQFVDEKTLQGYVHAPDFPKQLEWLNTDRPLSLKDFEGKVVLLDFWTFCCINCMHVIPDLKKLEAKYPNELVVIGVHSAKFTNEKDTSAIRQAILRYEIEHPVINDHDFEVWNSYGVHSWPTLVLINPKGMVIGGHSGEGAFEAFDAAIAAAVQYFDQKGLLKKGPVKFELEKNKAPKTLLSFPGKISADPKNQRLFVTDSNHHQILIVSPDGTVQDVIGSGDLGGKDGSFETAQFHHPQGTVIDGGTLYIADTENHLIRKADLKKRTVETVLGTGQQARTFNKAGRGTAAALSSPWDLTLLNGTLYIAMAGSHQLWTANPATWDTAPFAGSVREARVDGPRLSAALAQPSGLTTDGRLLYFADSETSSIRSADPAPQGTVQTLIGHDLFDYGDIDGGWEKARLQHALGVVWQNGLLYTADTYNSKIKIVDPKARTSTLFAGSEKRGTRDGSFKEAQFNEPGGLAFLDGKLYVADTNNHQIRLLDLEKQTVSTLPLKIKEHLASTSGENFKGKKVAFPIQTAAPGRVKFSVQISIPKENKFTPGVEANFKIISADAAVVKVLPENLSRDLSKDHSAIPFSLETHPGLTELRVETVIYHCTKDAKHCYFEPLRLSVPLKIEPGAPGEISLSYTIENPAPKGAFKNL